MKVVTMVMLMLKTGLCGASEQCSDTLGSCQSPRASLMQMRSLSQKQLSVASTAQGMSAKLAGFQKFTEEMVAKYGSDPEPLYANETEKKNTQTAIATVHRFILKLTGDFGKWHDEDALEVQNCRNASIKSSCESEEFNGDKGENKINEFGASANAKATEHLKCRNERQTACNDKNTACDAYHHYRKTNDSALLPDCVLEEDENGLVDDDFESRLSQDWISSATDAEVEQMELCLKETHDDWLIPLWNKYIQCSEDTKECDDQGVDCDKLQLEFESKQCVYGEKKIDECTFLQKCKERKTKTCNGFCTGLTGKVAMRKADDETAQRLKCLLEVLFGNWTNSPDNTGTGTFEEPEKDRTAGLQRCRGEQYGDAMRKWDLNCEDTPSITQATTADQICNAKVLMPCEEEFLHYFYKNNSLALYDGVQRAPEEDGNVKRVGECMPGQGGCSGGTTDTAGGSPLPLPSVSDLVVKRPINTQ